MNKAIYTEILKRHTTLQKMPGIIIFEYGNWWVWPFSLWIYGMALVKHGPRSGVTRGGGGPP